MAYRIDSTSTDRDVDRNTWYELVRTVTSGSTTWSHAGWSYTGPDDASELIEEEASAKPLTDLGYVSGQKYRLVVYDETDRSYFSTIYEGRLNINPDSPHAGFLISDYGRVILSTDTDGINPVITRRIADRIVDCLVITDINPTQIVIEPSLIKL